MEEMNRIIKFELEYIPNGSAGSIQNKLRYHYNLLRRKGLAKGVSREECLRDAIDRLREGYPNFDPKFDEKFFKMPPESLSAKEVVRRFFGATLSVLASCLMTYYVINTFHFMPSFQETITLLGVVALGAFVGGFISANFKAGFLSGLLTGIIGVPLVEIYLATRMLRGSFEFILTSAYTQNLGTYILFGLVGGTVGVAGAWAEGKLVTTN